jgi:hypothetical protein
MTVSLRREAMAKHEARRGPRRGLDNPARRLTVPRMFGRMLAVALILAIGGGAVAATDPIHQQDQIVMVAGADVPHVHATMSDPMWTLLAVEMAMPRSWTFAPTLS